MSYPPPYGPPPPWHHPPPHHYPPHHYPPPHHHQHPYPPPPEGAPPYPYYVPGTMMIPVPIAPVPPTPGTDQFGQPTTYITNYIYNAESTSSTDNTVQVVENSGDFEWIPTTAMAATTLTGRAVSGGHEGWDGSPLWVIRSWHNGDLIPGKLSVRHNAASVVYDGKEIGVQNIEVLCAKPENLRWVPASNGSVPPGAIPGGRVGGSGETLYIGRARYQLSVTPGKVHPSHHCCYIAFAGTEVAHKMYDVLCRVS